jgi:hypothetical protein
MEIAHVTLRGANDGGGTFSETFVLSTRLYGGISETTIVFIVEVLTKFRFQILTLC